MRATIFPAATTMIAFSAMLASGPAPADDIHVHGAPIQSGSQCFKYSTSFERDARFGYWSACPQTASVAVAPTTNSRPVRTAVAPTANSHPVHAAVALTTNSHRVRVAVAPTAHLVRKDEMTEIRHLKMKIGDSEFEADVPENKVQPMYDEFLSSLKGQSQIAEHKPDANLGAGSSTESSR